MVIWIIGGFLVMSKKSSFLDQVQDVIHTTSYKSRAWIGLVVSSIIL
jgi:hypothetical protein